MSGWLVARRIPLLSFSLPRAWAELPCRVVGFRWNGRASNLIDLGRLLDRASFLFCGFSRPDPGGFDEEHGDSGCERDGEDEPGCSNETSDDFLSVVDVIDVVTVLDCFVAVAVGVGTVVVLVNDFF